MGIFPSKLKIAKILPLFKKNDPYIMDNYRPISLFTSLSKLFKKINLFYDNQYSFCKLHSAELAAMKPIKF